MFPHQHEGALATFGIAPEGGIHRPAFGDAHLAARRALDAWARQFTQIARVTLRDSPALLDKLDL